MEGGPWKIFLAAIALIQLTHAQVKIEDLEPGKQLKFYGGIYNVLKTDFPLLDNETDLIYSRHVGPSDVFAYATYNPSGKTIVVKVASLKENTEFRNATCEFDFEVPDNDTVVIDSLRAWGRDKIFSITFTWHVEGKEEEMHLDRLDSITCHQAAYLRKVKDPKGKKKSRAEEKTDSAMNEADAAKAAALAQFKIPEDYYFVGKANAAASTERINYVNTTSGAVILASTINNRPHVDGLGVESLALNRYGVCYEADMKLTCAQGPLQAKVEPGKLEKWASLPLPSYHDWLGVVNYAEGRMLLIMGDMGGTCTPDKNCDYFLLYEMRPNGKIYRHAGAHILLGGCSNPAELTVDAYHHENGTCFTMACVGLSDSKRTLKYRQACATLV